MLRTTLAALVLFFIGCSSSPDVPPGGDGGPITDGGTTGDSATDSSPVSCPRNATVGPAAGPLALYPAPRYSALTNLGPTVARVCIDTSALATHTKLDALLPEMVADAGLTLGSGCACDWSIAFSSSPPSLDANGSAAYTKAGTNPDRYVVTTDATGKTTAFAPAEPAGLYALQAAFATVQKDPSGKLRPAIGTIVDYPDVLERGVVEGIYGPSGATNFWLPYRPLDRIELLQLMSRVRMNAFIYGPKSDYYSGPGGWNAQYNISNGQVIAAAAHEADRRLIRFEWAVRPLSLFSGGAYSSQLAALEAKLDGVRALGVSHFALFWDDSIDYSGTVSQRIQLMNDIDSWIKKADPKDHLTVVSDPYCCTSGNSDTSAFGSGLHSDIEIMWTGTGVEPTTMTASQMSGVDSSYKRKVTIWDNWPNTPGGFAGRSTDLPSAITGYFSNPVLNEYPGPANPIMTFFQVVGPIADYTWNAAKYAASSSSESGSYNTWQPELKTLHAKYGACVSCGSYGDYWTCSKTDPKAIEFCDPTTHCLTTIACSSGCAPQPNPNPDICHF